MASGQHQNIITNALYSRQSPNSSEPFSRGVHVMQFVVKDIVS